jgi:hypothetical protein
MLRFDLSEVPGGMSSDRRLEPVQQPRKPCRIPLSLKRPANVAKVSENLGTSWGSEPQVTFIDPLPLWLFAVSPVYGGNSSEDS